MEQENFNDTKSQDIAKAFVKQYYYVLQKLPQAAHNFYKDQSIRCHPRADGLMKSVKTRMDINDEIMACNVVQWIPDLDTMYAQRSVMESVCVGVSGTLIDDTDVERSFVQTFILAKQEDGGFYLHNDVLQLIDNVTIPAIRPPLDEVANLLTAQQLHDTVKEDTLETAKATNKDQTDKCTSKKEDDDIKNKVAESSKGKNILTVEPKRNSQNSVRKSAEKMQEKAKQVSYTSMSAQDQGSGSSTASPAVPKPSVFPNNGPPQNICDVKSVWIKNLPLDMTKESLFEAMKHFGPVKQRNIHIKAYPKDNYCYAFVEFDHPEAANNAVEARFLRFTDKCSEIQYRKFPKQGGQTYARRLPYGQGGHGNANFRGRDGEGRGSGRWNHRHIEHENNGQYYGQTRDRNYRDNRYSQGHY